MPVQVSNEALTHDALVSTFQLLEGEEVVLSTGLGEGGSRLTILGTLSLYDYSGGTGVAVGAARLLLSHREHLEAQLSTFDGNDFFQITLVVAGTLIAIGDPGLLGTDEFA